MHIEFRNFSLKHLVQPRMLSTHLLRNSGAKHVFPKCPETKSEQKSLGQTDFHRYEAKENGIF